MHVPLFRRAHLVRLLWVLSMVLGIATSLYAAGKEVRGPNALQRTRSTTLRWSAEQKEVLNGMQTLAAEARFRPPARQFEREVLRTEPALVRARALSQKPAGDPSDYDDVILQLQHHRARLLQLQREMTAIADPGLEVRNSRQLAASQFENANQKATQYINLLASVLKTMNEMRTGIIRNLR